jgi:hypothetical protein
MRAFWSDPYLWLHAAGVAAVPLWLLVCLLGFAVGNPSLPPWLELGLVAIAGVAPIAWMQSQRPFCIYSLLVVALRPERLTEDQRKVLALFRARRNPIWIAGGALLLFLVLKLLYDIAPIASEITPFPPEWRGVGLLIAAIGFLGSSLFLEVPLSVLQVMLASDRDFASAAAVPVEQISKNFLIFGVRVNQILPAIEPELAHSETKSTASESGATSV